MANLLINYYMNSTTVSNPGGAFSAQFSDSTVVQGPGNTLLGNYPQALRLGSLGKAACNVSALPINAEYFCINLVFRATEAVQAQQNILESDLLPFRVFLSPGSFVNTFHLAANIKPRNHDWSGPDTLFKQELSLNTWYAISLVYDLDTLALVVNNQLISIHAFPEGVIEKSAGTTIYFGTGADGQTHHFSGELAGFQWYDGIPLHLQQTMNAGRFLVEWFVSHKYEALRKTFQTGGRTGQLTYLSSIGAYIQRYENCAIMYSSGQAFEMHGAIYDRYKGLANPLSLGYLLSDESDTSRAGGKKNVFSKGGIYWSSATGAHPVIAQIHLEYDRQGESDALGFPTGEQRTIPGGFEQDFYQSLGELGNAYRVYYKNGEAQASVVQGNILSKYLSVGGVSRCGFPISNPSNIVDANGSTIGSCSEFENCTIYSSSAGTFEIRSEIKKKYDDLNGPLSDLGFPTSDTINIPNSGGQMNTFQNGSILWYGGNDFIIAKPFRIFIDRIESQNEEGLFGGQNELYFRTLRLTQNGTVIFQTRLPNDKNYFGEADNIDIKHTIDRLIVPNNADMTIELYIDVWEWDDFLLVNDEYMGTYTKVLDASNGWGFRESQGVYNVKFGKINSLTWNIKPDINIDELEEHEKWWGFENDPTNPLTYQQYGSAFKIDPNPQWWDLTDWIEKAFYEIIKTSTTGGSCFGMSLEAIYSRKEKSLFAMPLNRFTDPLDYSTDLSAKIANELGIKHVYQVGADPIWWIVGEFLTGKTHDPVALFNRTFDAHKKGHHPVICLTQRSSFKGAAHAILPVAWDKSQKPWKITILDPNFPCHPNYVSPCIRELIVDPDNNTFEYSPGYIDSDKIENRRRSKSYAGGSSSGGRLWYYPFSMLDRKQRFPWDVLFTGLFVTGLYVLVMVGDSGETESITDDAGNDLDAFGTRAAGLLSSGTLPSEFFVGVPVFGDDAKPGQILARSKAKSSFIHNVRGTRNGEFNYGFTTGMSDIHLKSTLNLNETHKLKIDDSGDVCKLHVDSQREKNLILTVNNKLGASDDCLQCVIQNMPIGPTHGLEAAFRPGIGGFELVNHGEKTNLNITLRARRNKQETTKSLVIPMDKGIHLNPFRLLTEVLISHITLNETELTMDNGTTRALVATVTPANATRKIPAWTSDEHAVATVDANGLVAARGAGRTNIVATSKDGGAVSASCAVTVAPALSNRSLTDITHENLKFSATCTDNATAHWVVRRANEPAPTAAQIVAGAGANTGAMTANVPFSRTFSGLSSRTSYRLHFVALSNGIFSTVWNEEFKTLPLPIVDVPTGLDGRILTPAKTGDTVNWIELARNGNYALIVRAAYINIHPNRVMSGKTIWDDPNWQYTSFGSTLNYMTAANSVRMKLNAWFNGTAQGEAEKLPANARLRNFTVQTNVSQAMGTSSWPASVNDGFSKPTRTLLRTGDDIAFALSYGESASFLSLLHFLRGVYIANQPSSAAAQANYAKISIPLSYAYYGMWLRSPGDLPNTAAFLCSTFSQAVPGRVFQEQLSGRGLLYPALWVDEYIFDDD